MFSTPNSRDDAKIGSGGDQNKPQNRYLSVTSPNFLSNGISVRPKPRLFTSPPRSAPIPPNGEGLSSIRDLSGETDLKLEGERPVKSSSKNTESRVRRELEESQLLLLTKTHNIAESSIRKIALVKESFDSVLAEKEFEWEKKLSDTVDEYEKKIVKLMNDAFEKRQQALKESNAEKEILTVYYQAQELKDEKKISELKRRIISIEECSSSTLKSLAEHEIENRDCSGVLKKELELLRISSEMREKHLMGEIEKKIIYIMKMEKQEKEKIILQESTYQSEISAAMKRHQDKETELKNNIQELFEQKDKAEKCVREKNEKLNLLQGEVDELIIKNKIFNEKINDENVKLITEMIEKKEIEKRYLHLEENLKKFRKVMFEKELGDRKLISDLRKNLLAANQNLKMTEINKKVEFERKKVNYNVMEKLFNSGQIKLSNEVREEFSATNTEIPNYENQTSSVDIDESVEMEKKTRNLIDHLVAENARLKDQLEEIKSNEEKLSLELLEAKQETTEIQKLHLDDVSIHNTMIISQKNEENEKLEKMKILAFQKENELKKEISEKDLKIVKLIGDEEMIEKTLLDANNIIDNMDKRMEEKDLKLSNLERIIVEKDFLLTILAEEKERNEIRIMEIRENGIDAINGIENSVDGFGADETKDGNSELVKRFIRNGNCNDKGVNGELNYNGNNFDLGDTRREIDGNNSDSDNKNENERAVRSEEEKMSKNKGKNIENKVLIDKNVRHGNDEKEKREREEGEGEGEEEREEERYLLNDGSDADEDDHNNGKREESSTIYSKNRTYITNLSHKVNAESDTKKSFESKIPENSANFCENLILEMRERETEMMKHIEKANHKKNKLQGIIETKNIIHSDQILYLTNKIKYLQKKLSERKYWKKVAVCVAEATVHTCAGALSIPDTTSTSFSRSVSRSRNDRSRNSKMTTDGKQNSPFPGDNRVFDFIVQMRSEGKVLVDKELLASALLMSKGIIERSH